MERSAHLIAHLLIIDNYNLLIPHQVFQVRKTTGNDKGKIFAMKVLKKVSSLRLLADQLLTHLNVIAGCCFVGNYRAKSKGHCAH